MVGCLTVSPFAFRALSTVGGANVPPPEAACTSSPAVNARPAPLKIMARTLESVDSLLKRAERLCHILIMMLAAIRIRVECSISVLIRFATKNCKHRDRDVE